MKSSLLQAIRVQTIVTTLLSGLFATSTLVGCSSFKDQKQSDTYQVPWENADGSYSVQNVKITSLTDPDDLSGSNLKIMVMPGASGSQLSAPTAVGHFIVTKDGTKVPRDAVSLEGVTVQAHIERLRALAAKAGVESAISWPITVAIETVASDPSTFINNACFDGTFNALMTSIYRIGTSLPLALNGGVLGHEFFHMIFNQIVYARLGGHSGQTTLAATGATSDVDSYNTFLLRGMNEGLADFWGWIYSGDDNFIKASLPQVEDQRNLSVQVSSLQTTEQMKACLQAAESSTSPSYPVGNQIYYTGTRYARFFRQLTVQQVGIDQREQMAKILMDSIKAFSETTAARVASANEISPNDIIFSVFDHLPKVDDDACTLYDQVAASSGEILADRPAKCLAFPRHTDVQNLRTMFNQINCGPAL